MIERQEESNNFEIFKKGFENFFKGYKKKLAFMSDATTGMADYLLDKFYSDKKELTEEVIKSFCECELNTNHLSVEKIREHKSIIDNEVEN